MGLNDEKTLGMVHIFIPDSSAVCVNADCIITFKSKYCLIQSCSYRLNHGLCRLLYNDTREYKKVLAVRMGKKRTRRPLVQV